MHELERYVLGLIQQDPTPGIVLSKKLGVARSLISMVRSEVRPISRGLLDLAMDYYGVKVKIQH